MEKLLTGLSDFSIKKVVSYNPVRLDVIYRKDTHCTECGSTNKRIKASFYRKIKSVPQHRSPVMLHVLCHKFHCKQCGRYFNTRTDGVKKWSRSTEPLKNNVFHTCSRGYPRN